MRFVSRHRYDCAAPAGSQLSGGNLPPTMFTLGIDYGTNSVRALVVRCADGAEFGSSVVNYPSGKQGVLLDPKDHNLARQHPADYLVGLEQSVKGALAAAKKKKGFTPDRI